MSSLNFIVVCQAWDLLLIYVHIYIYIYVYHKNHVMLPMKDWRIRFSAGDFIQVHLKGPQLGLPCNFDPKGLSAWEKMTYRFPGDREIYVFRGWNTNNHWRLTSFACSNQETGTFKFNPPKNSFESVPFEFYVSIPTACWLFVIHHSICFCYIYIYVY